MGLTIDNTGLIHWIPGYNDEGQYSIAIAVTDGKGGSSNQAYTLNVSGTNRDPQITSLPITTVAEGQPYEYAIVATDDDGDSLAYTLTSAPQGMIVDSNGLVQ